MAEEQQIPMFVDDLNEALSATINALGGKKAVGSMLRGEAMDPTAAGKWVAACLNPGERERFNPDQVACIRRAARAAGCHILAAWEAKDAGYAPPQPIAPEDENAQLQREFIASVKAQQAILERLSRNGMQAVG